MHKSLMARWRASFSTGPAVVLPGVIALAVMKWLFGTISSFTDILLFFLPYWPGPKVIKLDMLVADELKYIISAGALANKLTPLEVK